MSKLRPLEPFVVALLAGALAIVGGYLATRQAFRGERDLRDAQRSADTQAAARVLDLELVSRLRLAFGAAGLSLPRGDIKAAAVQERWDCAVRELERTLSNAEGRPADCVSVTQPPEPATRLKPIAWSADDRHLLAARMDGGDWFAVTTAVDWWTTVADRHAAVGELGRRVRASPQAAGTLAEAVRNLTRAREALKEYVARRG